LKGSENKNCGVLNYRTALWYDWLPVFWRNVLSASSHLPWRWGSR